MNPIFVAAILLVTANISCQQALKYTETVNKYYSINKHFTSFITFEITNESEKSILIWIDYNKNSNVNKYFFKKKLDFSLSNLIYENLLSPNNMLIGETFIKILEPRNKFRFHVCVEPENDNKAIENFRNYIKSYEFDKFISEYKFNKNKFPTYSGFDIFVNQVME